MHKRSQTLRHVLTGTLAATALAAASACQTNAGSGDTETRSASLSEYQALFRHCVEHGGGPGMDSIELLAGRLSVACSRWAYRRSRR